MKHNDITVILLLYQTPKKYIQNLKNYQDFRLIILDQSNDIKTKKILTKKYKNIVFYKLSKKNLGFAKGQNLLINKVRTKYFFSTQADIIIKKKDIIKLKKLLHKYKNNLIAIPNINKKYENSKKKYLYIKEMIGAAFMSETSIFKKFGKFDERFFFYWEDIDLNERINKSKFKIVTDVSSRATHFSGNSSLNNIKSRFVRGVNFRFGEYLFLYKYKKFRFLKLLREIILNFFRMIFNLIFLKIEKVEKNIFNLLGILKFILFIVYKTD